MDENELQLKIKELESLKAKLEQDKHSKRINDIELFAKSLQGKYFKTSPDRMYQGINSGILYIKKFVKMDVWLPRIDAICDAEVFTFSHPVITADEKNSYGNTVFGINSNYIKPPKSTHFSVMVNCNPLIGKYTIGNIEDFPINYVEISEEEYKRIKQNVMYVLRTFVENLSSEIFDNMNAKARCNYQVNSKITELDEYAKDKFCVTTGKIRN